MANTVCNKRNPLLTFENIMKGTGGLGQAYADAINRAHIMKPTGQKSLS